MMHLDYFIAMPIRAMSYKYWGLNLQITYICELV